MKSKRAKACDISLKVRRAVFERDNNGICILCGRPGSPNSHYLPRSSGGLGIEQNIVTMCVECHHKLDNTSERKNLLAFVKAYLDEKYPDFPDEKRVYRRGEE